MESKTARLTVLIDPAKKKALEQLCASQDLTSSQVVRQLIRDYLADHGVRYGPGATERDSAAPAVHNPVVATRPRNAAKARKKAGPA